ncbi:hypothetical protein ACLRGF_14325 [Mycetocola zhadangensis]|uniref:hypothetical protein n=1 Tax=Mycetocola zhadangensis TaxID=1164595 RepID=UPI003A4D3B9D
MGDAGYPDGHLVLVRVIRGGQEECVLHPVQLPRHPVLSSAEYNQSMSSLNPYVRAFQLIPRRMLIVGATVLVGATLVVASWLLRDDDPWWSALLANVAVFAMLLIPGELLLARFGARIERAEGAADNAQVTADEAQRTAEDTARSLQDVRSGLIERQLAELEAELDVYREIVNRPSRETMLGALRKATEDEVITRAGVRAPIWETDIHYRFVVDDTLSELEVRLEHDDGKVISSVVWEPDAAPEAFYQQLVLEVRAAGHDRGTALNDSTQSVQELSEMLVEVARLRSQELAGHRQTLRRIIERRDGWYFTEDYVIPADSLSYTIATDRLNEMDWEQHLLNKGWYTAPSAIEFARTLYGVDVRGDLEERAAASLIPDGMGNESKQPFTEIPSN